MSFHVERLECLRARRRVLSRACRGVKREAARYGSSVVEGCGCVVVVAKSLRARLRGKCWNWQIRGTGANPRRFGPLAGAEQQNEFCHKRCSKKKKTPVCHTLKKQHRSNHSQHNAKMTKEKRIFTRLPTCGGSQMTHEDIRENLSSTCVEVHRSSCRYTLWGKTRRDGNGSDVSW